MQARLFQRRGLAGAGRADDHIPRHLAQELLRAQAGLLHLAKDFGEFGVDRGKVRLARPDGCGLRRRGQFGHEHPVLPRRPKLRQKDREKPQDHHHADGDQAVQFLLQRMQVAQRQKRPELPDQRAKKHDADEDPQLAGDEKAEQTLDQAHVRASSRS